MSTMESGRILVVDDDDELKKLLKRFLEKNGFIYSDLPDTDNIRNKIINYKPDLMIFDIMLPGIDGVETLKKLRQSGCEIPIIFLSARNDAIDKIIGLESGADDYIGKPFVPHELLARIRAILRRNSKGMAVIYKNINFGDFRIDLDKKILWCDREIIRLSNIEYCALEVMAMNLNKVVSRNQLIDGMYGMMSDVSERTIDVLIWRLRKIIEPIPSMPSWLVTVRGVGYMLRGELIHEKH